MRALALEREPSALIFDLDSTLYTNKEYAAFQEEVLVERLGRELGLGPGGAEARIASLRAQRAAAGQGRTSLGTLFAALGVDIATSVRWREECIDPGRWLSRDERLDRALSLLEREFRLALVTNNPRLVGRKSLQALGVDVRFEIIVGLDDTMSSKPSPRPFEEAARRLELQPALCASIGDRADVDLAPAMSLGMGALLVDGVEDVYALPSFLAGRFGKPLAETANP
jgi:phosphoglycolate phosphatase/putative hydrolase of the HAD superfamily